MPYRPRIEEFMIELMRGKCRKEIADKYNISIETVKSTIRDYRAKHELVNQYQIIVHLLKSGKIKLEEI